MVRMKLLTELDDLAIDFIKRSPFLVLSTADADGNQDASPKGDHPGFVLVENPSTIVIPERKGNKLLFGLQNILANPHVAMVFMLPGTGETLRVNGIAELTTDPELLGKLTARGAACAARNRASRSMNASSTAPRPSFDRSCGGRRPGASACPSHGAPILVPSSD